MELILVGSRGRLIEADARLKSGVQKFKPIEEQAPSQQRTGYDAGNRHRLARPSGSGPVYESLHL